MPMKRKFATTGRGRHKDPKSRTSSDYAQQIADLEFSLDWRSADMTPIEKKQLTNKIRRLKNSMSALKSRERKRAKMSQLEQTIAELTSEVKQLKEDNSQLKAENSQLSLLVQQRSINKLLPKKSENSTSKLLSKQSENSTSTLLPKQSEKNIPDTKKRWQGNGKDTNNFVHTPSLNGIFSDHLNQSSTKEIWQRDGNNANNIFHGVCPSPSLKGTFSEHLNQSSTNAWQSDVNHANNIVQTHHTHEVCPPPSLDELFLEHTTQSSTLNSKQWTPSHCSHPRAAVDLCAAMDDFEDDFLDELAKFDPICVMP